MDHFIVQPQLGIFSFDNDEICQLRVVSEVLLRFCQLWPHVLVDKCCKLFRLSFHKEQKFYFAPLSTYLPLLAATNVVKGLVFLVFWAFLLDMSHLGRISRIANYYLFYFEYYNHDKRTCLDICWSHLIFQPELRRRILMPLEFQPEKLKNTFASTFPDVIFVRAGLL